MGTRTKRWDKARRAAATTRQQTDHDDGEWLQPLPPDVRGGALADGSRPRPAAANPNRRPRTLEVARIGWLVPEPLSPAAAATAAG